ncbi:MAG: glycosyltransferase [Lachnospiraceae bacterium]|nr:glycosyltransferase [Lachnospiraceae bacterium]
MAQISFSIVIVCLNPGKKLLPTVESVLKQQYGNYEILIKDGGSSDNSLAAVPADSRIRLVTSADTGIYDAMNQALPYLSGQYVLFLNCGDILHDSQVLSEMAKAIENKKASDLEGDSQTHKERIRIFYGNQYNEKQDSVVYSAPEVNDFTCYRNVPCHQVCFYDIRLFGERGYDTKYKVRADYEHFLYCIYERHAQAVYTELLVADYEGGGFSETAENRRISAKEHSEITKHYLGREKVLRYKTVMLLTLAPLRTKLAENEKYAGYYNAVKNGIYRVVKKRK